MKKNKSNYKLILEWTKKLNEAPPPEEDESKPEPEEAPEPEAPAPKPKATPEAPAQKAAPEEPAPEAPASEEPTPDPDDEQSFDSELPDVDPDSVDAKGGEEEKPEEPVDGEEEGDSTELEAEIDPRVRIRKEKIQRILKFNRDAYINYRNQWYIVPRDIYKQEGMIEGDEIVKALNRDGDIVEIPYSRILKITFKGAEQKTKQQDAG